MVYEVLSEEGSWKAALKKARKMLKIRITGLALMCASGLFVTD